MSKTLVFEMGMTCEGCANAARRVLAKLGDDKVQVVDIDVSTKKITVTSSLPSSEVMTALQKTGKEIKLLEEN